MVNFCNPGVLGSVSEFRKRFQNPILVGREPDASEAEQALGARFNIRSIPTLALFANGREVARQPGAMGAADIVRWTRAHL
jgi:thioredoxin-related protein